jgi:hypothetical protein
MAPATLVALVAAAFTLLLRLPFAADPKYFALCDCSK